MLQEKKLYIKEEVLLHEEGTSDFKKKLAVSKNLKMLNQKPFLCIKTY